MYCHKLFCANHAHAGKKLLSNLPIFVTYYAMICIVTQHWGVCPASFFIRLGNLFSTKQNRDQNTYRMKRIKWANDENIHTPKTTRASLLTFRSKRGILIDTSSHDLLLRISGH